MLFSQSSSVRVCMWLICSKIINSRKYNCRTPKENQWNKFYFGLWESLWVGSFEAVTLQKYFISPEMKTHEKENLNRSFAKLINTYEKDRLKISYFHFSSVYGLLSILFIVEVVIIPKVQFFFLFLSLVTAKYTKTLNNNNWKMKRLQKQNTTPVLDFNVILPLLTLCHSYNNTLRSGEHMRPNKAIHMVGIYCSLRSTKMVICMLFYFNVL